MLIIDLPQNTPEWLQARRGLVTASSIKDVLAKGKGGEEAKTRETYRVQKAMEILVKEHISSPGLDTAAIRWGKETEPMARTEYELRTGVMVVQVGLVLHPTIERAAASPDGLVGDKGLVEFKCPESHTHIRYIVGDTVPTEYQPQMLWQMACCEREWCDFVSFDPRWPENNQMFVKRFFRDDARIKAMETEVIKFNQEVDELVEKLRRM